MTLSMLFDVLHSLLVRWERVSFQHNGTFYVVWPEHVVEFVTPKLLAPPGRRFLGSWEPARQRSGEFLVVSF